MLAKRIAKQLGITCTLDEYLNSNVAERLKNVNDANAISASLLVTTTLAKWPELSREEAEKACLLAAMIYYGEEEGSDAMPIAE